MSVVAWDHEIDELKSYEDFMTSDYAKQCTAAYNADGKALPEEFRDFENYVLSGVSLKDIFYTKILPKSLQDEKTS